MQFGTEENGKGEGLLKEKEKNAFKKHIYESHIHINKIIYVRIYKKLEIRFCFLIKHLVMSYSK